MHPKWDVCGCSEKGWDVVSAGECLQCVRTYTPCVSVCVCVRWVGG